MSAAPDQEGRRALVLLTAVLLLAAVACGDAAEEADPSLEDAPALVTDEKQAVTTTSTIAATTEAPPGPGDRLVVAGRSIDLRSVSCQGDEGTIWAAGRDEAGAPYLVVVEQDLVFAARLEDDARLGAALEGPGRWTEFTVAEVGVGEPVERTPAGIQASIPFAWSPDPENELTADVGLACPPPLSGEATFSWDGVTRELPPLLCWIGADGPHFASRISDGPPAIYTIPENGLEGGPAASIVVMGEMEPPAPGAELPVPWARMSIDEYVVSSDGTLRVTGVADMRESFAGNPRFTLEAIEEFLAPYGADRLDVVIEGSCDVMLTLD